MSDLRNKLVKLAYDNPNLREALKPLLSEMVEEARFEKGVPADPTENMSPEEAEKWEEMKEKYKDKFKEKESNTESNMSDLRNKLVKLAYNKPELREDLLPLIKAAREVKITEDHFDEFFRDWPGGFSAWAKDERKRTLRELENRNYDSLAYEVAYSIESSIRAKNKEAPSKDKIVPIAMRWLDDRRESLIDELK